MVYQHSSPVASESRDLSAYLGTQDISRDLKLFQLLKLRDFDHDVTYAKSLIIAAKPREKHTT